MIAHLGMRWKGLRFSAGRGGFTYMPSAGAERLLTALLFGFAERMVFGAYYTASARRSRPQGTVLAASYWLRLRMCFLGGSQVHLLPSTTWRSAHRPSCPAGSGLVAERSSACALKFIRCFTWLICPNDGLRRLLHGERETLVRPGRRAIVFVEVLDWW